MSSLLQVEQEEELQSTPAVHGIVDRDAVFEQLKSILATSHFQSSRRSSELLRYIVERTLANDLLSLKERVIGVEVFGKDPGFDTGQDASVRVAANAIRKRLSFYYNEPGHVHELRIEIPPRSYVADFRIPAVASPSGTVENTQAHERSLLVATAPRHIRTLRWTGVSVLASLLLGTGVWIAHRAMSSSVTDFWSPLLDAQQNIILTIGDGPKARTDPAPAEAPSPEHLPSEALLQEKILKTPVSDETAMVDLASFLGKLGKISAFRLARTTSLSDLTGGPVVLLGGVRNDWATRLDANLHYKVRMSETDRHTWIEDVSNPSGRSWAVDLTKQPEQVFDEYALITRALEPSTGQWWVGIAGLTGKDTLAAERALQDPTTMTELARRLPRGWRHKNLQIVLGVRVIEGSAGTSRILATYVW